MTAKQQQVLVGVLRWLVPALVSVGAAWGTLGASIGQKLPASEFQVYKAHTDDELLQMNTTLQRIDVRTREMYCADKPPGCQ